MTQVPPYVQAFADMMLSARVSRLSIDACTPAIEGVHGILTTTHLQYADRDWQLLGRRHEYLFWIPGAKPLEISLQLYLNSRYHWRLFAYSKKGMLLSVNLTTSQQTTGVVLLEQRLKLASRSMTKEERDIAAGQLAEHLRRMGFDVAENRNLVLGTFHESKGLLDTTPKAFLRDFVVAAALKGHFMANKGYALPGVQQVKVSQRVRNREKSANKRAVSLGMRYQVLERDNGKCVLCGADPGAGVRLHVDHIIPWSQGGRTEVENLQTLCEGCNLGKGNRSQRSFKER